MLKKSASSGVFEHPETIQFPTPCSEQPYSPYKLSLSATAEVWELCFITWERRKLQEGRGGQLVELRLPRR
jgi:hypothetical protein